MLADPVYRICFVCSGSICRAPIAETVVRTLAERQGLEGIAVESAGTGDWHIGERPDLRTLRVLADHGYAAPTGRARQFDAQWFDRLDLVVAFDRGHARTLRSWATDEQSLSKVRLMRSFDPTLPAITPPGTAEGTPHLLDIPDPYYEDEPAFGVVLRLVEAAGAGLIEAVAEQLREPARR